MKIRIQSEAMAEAVAWAARSLPSRPSVPILAGLLIKADADGVEMSCFDYETSAKVSLPAEVIDEGTVLVSGKLLADITHSLPKKLVEITSDESTVQLVCGSARFTLQMLPVDDYPQLPEMPTVSGSVESNKFSSAINQVAVAAGRDELLPVFTGVRVEIEDDKLSMLATDRYRMALKEMTWNPSSTEIEGSALVPARVLAEVSRSLTGGEEVSLAINNEGVGDGIIGLTGENSGSKRELTTRLLGGEFPKVRHLMDITPKVTVKTKTADLIAAVKRVSLVAERNTPLRMLIADDQIALEAATGDQARGSEAVEAVVENMIGGELSLSAAGFNPHYLQDALSVLTTPYVYFAFTAAGKPCLVQGLEDLDGEPEPDYKHVIMLMRLPN